jgi:hypothetical protein
VFGGEIGMVAEWMPNGHVTDYSIQHPEVDKLKLVSEIQKEPNASTDSGWLCKICEIAAGLSYLHENKIVSGFRKD